MHRSLLVGLATIGAFSTMQPALAQSETAATDADSARSTSPIRNPDQIRCQRRPVTGSLYRTMRVCLTNRQWEQLFQEGNRDAYRIFDAGRINSLRGG